MLSLLLVDAHLLALQLVILDALPASLSSVYLPCKLIIFLRGKLFFLFSNSHVLSGTPLRPMNLVSPIRRARDNIHRLFGHVKKLNFSNLSSQEA